MLNVSTTGLDQLIKALDDKSVEKARVRATNTALARGRTAWSKAIRQDYTVKAGSIGKASKLYRLKYQGQRAGIELSSPVLPLRDFGAKQVAKGVSVKIRKGESRKIVKSAFIVNSIGGHVFKRRGDNRLPIDKLMTLSIPQMGDDPEAVEAATNAIGDSYSKEFRRQLELIGERL